MPQTMAQRVQQFGTTIFTEMTNLARQHDAVNLGQGFPDFPAPDFVKAAGLRAIRNDANQYAHLLGDPRLREALAAKLRRHDGLDPNPQTEIAVAHGATECIFATIMGLVNPGDEVIIFEPYYDSYVPCVEFAGGVPKFYTLRPPNWEIDPATLEALFSEKTRLICINTPHNPTGKVYSARELQLIADLCQKYDALAMVDGVYEHIVFDDARHLTLATRPGMWERTITISSLGKTFSVTGWKVGWAVAPAEIIQAIVRAYQFVTFSGVAPMQAAAADILLEAEENDYYAKLADLYTRKRNILVAGLQAVGLKPLTPQGSYFIMADISELGFENDVAFCRFLTREVGVAAIPPSAFYVNPADGASIARFTFCKQDAALEEAVRRLHAWRENT